MDCNFSRALTLVLKSEGGWLDNPVDPSGAMMKGVTLANFRRYVKADASKADLPKISDAQIATVYRGSIGTPSPASARTDASVPPRLPPWARCYRRAGSTSSATTAWPG